VAIGAVRGMAATAGATPGNGGHPNPGFGGSGERGRRGEWRPGSEGRSEREGPEPEGGYGRAVNGRKLGTTFEAGKELQVGARAPSAALKQVGPLVGRSLSLAVAVHERRIEEDSGIARGCRSEANARGVQPVRCWGVRGRTCRRVRAADAVTLISRLKPDKKFVAAVHEHESWRLMLSGGH
jgi:hypothetical protein